MHYYYSLLESEKTLRMPLCKNCEYFERFLENKIELIPIFPSIYWFNCEQFESIPIY